MATTKTRLVLGRGKVYFEPYVPGSAGDGERYVGNTPEFSIDREIEMAPRFTSYGGRKVERNGAPLQEKNTISFVTDDISLENVGLWYGLDAHQTTITGINEVTEFFSARPDRYYQLGMLTYAQGVRSVENVKVRINDTPVPETGNYSLDKETGRLYVPADSIQLLLGVDFFVDFEWRTTVSEQVAAQPQVLTGAVRFIANNAYGRNRNYYFPMVQIMPTGSFDMKGDTFQQIAFKAEARERSPWVKQLYVDSPIVIGTTEDEQAIINEGSLTLAEFAAYEDMLDIAVYDWAWAVLGLSEEDFAVFEPAFDTLINETFPAHNY